MQREDKNTNKYTVRSKIRAEFSDKLPVSIKAVLMLIFLLVFFGIYLKHGKGYLDYEPWVNKIIETLFSGVLITTIIVLAERFMEKRNIITSINESMTSFQSSTRNELESLLSLKFKFGFKEIIKSVDEGDIIVAPTNTNIKWLNTKFSEQQKVEKNIEISIKNGCNVQLLMMHKDNYCAAYRAMGACDDYMNEDHLKLWVEDYQKRIGLSYKMLLDFYKRVSEISDSNEGYGKLDIRFYEGVPGIPILIIDRENRLAEGWSGFFLTKYSSENPYIKWQPEENGFLYDLNDYFDKKWYFSRANDAKILIQEVTSTP